MPKPRGLRGGGPQECGASVGTDAPRTAYWFFLLPLTRRVVLITAADTAYTKLAGAKSALTSFVKNLWSIGQFVATAPQGCHEPPCRHHAD